MKELVIRTSEGTSRIVPLTSARLTIGRSESNDLSYPEDTLLSRQHLRLEKVGEEWWVVDLGSKNGTQLNGRRLTSMERFRMGDAIAAGRLTIYAADESGPQAAGLEFVEDAGIGGPLGTTVVTHLDRVITPKTPAAAPVRGEDMRRTQALIDAGRELAGHKPLEDLFHTILKLATEAVRAKRGVLMTLERGELIVRSHQGEGFRISKAVRDRVLNNKESLLVADADQDAMFKGSRTIVEQQVRSLMAVPLQTNNEVIGLIYVDSTGLLSPFVPEDLNLLTVMSNVAAIRIEHARLVEVEQTERLMAKDMEQAAEIQRSLLPSQAPTFPGLELAGHSSPCRAVGGDYYDFFELEDGRLMVVVGDVSGKGLPAALLMSSLQARVQVLGETFTDAGLFMTQLNRSIASKCPSNRFITFVAAVIEPATGRVEFCNAGHNPPCLVRKSGEFELLGAGGPPLAILPRMSYEPEERHMEAGDLLVLYSDGVSEARNPADDEFTEQRLHDLLVSWRAAPTNLLVEGVVGEVYRFMAEAPAADDLTLVAVRRV